MMVIFNTPSDASAIDQNKNPGKTSSKKTKDSAPVRRNTCPRGIDGKALREIFPFYSHEIFERLAKQKEPDVVNPNLRPITTKLRLGAGIYNAYAIDGRYIGAPTVDDIGKIADLNNLEKMQTLPVSGHCFVYVEEPINKDVEDGKDNQSNPAHKPVLILITNKNHTDIKNAVDDFLRAVNNPSPKSDSDNSDDTSQSDKQDDQDDDQNNDADDNSDKNDEKILKKGANTQDNSDNSNDNDNNNGSDNNGNDASDDNNSNDNDNDSNNDSKDDSGN